MFITIDARGWPCPRPVIATKKALEEMVDGILSVVVDNLAAKENVVKFATINQCEVKVEEKDNLYSITFTKGQGTEEDLAHRQVHNDTVYLITQQTLGQGNRELGAILIKSFFYALLEKEPLPRAIMFINSGVFLTTENSPVSEHLATLSAKGVQIQSCGLCLDYYELKDKLVVGNVTNMYSIIEELSSSVKAITL